MTKRDIQPGEEAGSSSGRAREVVEGEKRKEELESELCEGMSSVGTVENATATAYPHQVGGHGQLAVTVEGRVLKPLQKKELDFYRYIHSDTLPESLRWIREVTPKFYGEQAYPTSLPVDLHPPPQPSSSNPSAQPHGVSDPLQPQTPRWRMVPPLPSEASVDDPHSLLANPLQKEEKACASAGAGRQITEVAVSPWVATMRLRTREKKKKPLRSIALEDINRHFQLPCVWDCKMGTRHYDDDASDEKRRRHIAKALATTSMQCGVRYTGMQSWKRHRHGRGEAQEEEGVFEMKDKYDGRRLVEADLIPQATWFFDDGTRVRVDCVKPILERLRRLRDHLGVQEHFLFYSSSLLLVYDAVTDDAPRVDVRMIDFAHTVLSDGRRDDGYLKGLCYLIRILEQILVNHSS